MSSSVGRRLSHTGFPRRTLDQSRQNGAMMVFLVVVVVAAGFGVWFVRTPLFRGHLRRGKSPDPEQLRTGGIQFNDWKDLPPGS